MFKKKKTSVFNFAKARKRVAVSMLIFLVLSIVIIVARLWQLQVVKGDYYKASVLNQTEGSLKIEQPRGDILDVHGEPLAQSIVVKILCVSPQKVRYLEAYNEKNLPDSEAKKEAAKILAPLINVSEKELLEDFNSKRIYMYLKRQIEFKKALVIQKALDEKHIVGFNFEKESKRFYPQEKLAAQVIGFAGTDEKARSGLELEYNKVLQGNNNEIERYVRDAYGNHIGESAMEETKERKLPTVYLTLDSKMQYVIERSLDEAMEKTKSKSACAILMNPHTGAILAMASRPTFNPNKYYLYAWENMRNRAIGMLYEPGSVFKPIVVSEALSDGVITKDTLFNDLGRIKVADRIVHNWDDTGRGMVTYSDVVKYSLNTGMAHLGLEMGANRMCEAADEYGFGKRTGIRLPGEESGIMYKAKNMYKPDIAIMAIGQGFAVTPLQMITAISAIANGGELVKPYIVDKITDANGNIIIKNKKKVVRRVVSSEDAHDVRGMMEQVVSGGGGKTAAIKGYRIAGKTGTAQKLADTGGYAPGKYIASFVGFVPSHNPEFAMLILLDTPKGVFYGSQVAGPVFKDTLQQILAARGLEPSDSEGLPSMEQFAIKYQEKMRKKLALRQKEQTMPNEEVVPVEVGSGEEIVPNFKGQNMRTVMQNMERTGFKLVPHGNGFAIRQSLKPGSAAAKDALIEVWFAEEKDSEK